VEFLNRLVYIDETWIHIYDPETKKQIKNGSPRQKKLKTQKSSSKVSAPVFSDKEGILLLDYPQTGATITAKYYVSLHHKLKKQHLVSKRRSKQSQRRLQERRAFN
jgi:hypothetical protein